MYYVLIIISTDINISAINKNIEQQCRRKSKTLLRISPTNLTMSSPILSILLNSLLRIPQSITIYQKPKATLKLSPFANRSSMRMNSISRNPFRSNYLINKQTNIRILPQRIIKSSNSQNSEMMRKTKSLMNMGNRRAKSMMRTDIRNCQINWRPPSKRSRARKSNFIVPHRALIF